MSKYKVGDKFVVEIEEVHKEEFLSPNYYELKNIDVLFSEDIINKLQKYENVDSASLVRDGINIGHKKGMEEAWDIARKIACYEEDGGFPSSFLEKIFGDIPSRCILAKFSANEAKERIEACEKEKEEEQKIHVGDVIRHKNQRNVVLIVTEIREDGNINAFKISENDICGNIGSVYFNRSIENFEKTGQHYDLSKIFALAGDSDGSK